jgi:hypothetical protein
MTTIIRADVTSPNEVTAEGTGITITGVRLIPRLRRALLDAGYSPTTVQLDVYRDGILLASYPCDTSVTSEPSG